MNIPMKDPVGAAGLEPQIRRIEDLLRKREASAAEALSARVAQDFPDRVEGWLLLGRARQQRGDFAGTLDAATRATALKPKHSSARLLFVEALLQCGRAVEAMAALSALETDACQDPLLLQHIGQFYTHTNRHAEAERCYRRAAVLVPWNSQYLYNLATATSALGNLDEAEALLDRVIAAAPRDYDAYYNRATLRLQTREHNHVPEMERALGASPGPGEIKLGYALAKELEDLGEHQRAFAYLERAASARRRQLSYRAEDDIAAMAEIERVFGRSLFAHANSGHDDRRPVFIVGLPRSGTTLVDRILGSHSKVENLGESNTLAVALVRLAGAGVAKMDLIQRAAQLDFAALGRAYCDGTTPLNANTPRLTDKTPVNFLYLGLIALSLPNAHIVHVRRNAMDVCYAMYKTLFRMAYPFSYDLADLGRYYLAYHRLMAHWREVLPGRFLDLDYEALVADQEGESRRLIAHCGLEWEAACLAFDRNARPSLTASAAQVRQPIYATSVGLWRRYAAGLAPLAKILRAGGIEVESAV